MPMRSFCVVLLLCSLLSAGCGSVGGAKGFESGAKTRPPGAESDAQSLQSGNERNMVVLFRILLEMDRSGTDPFTGRQAEQMLPLVKNGIAKGELSSEEFDQIVMLFSDKQRALYQQMIERWNSRARSVGGENKRGRKRAHLTPEDESRLEDEFEKRRMSESAGENEGRPRNESESNMFQGKNLERQVVEMLQNKLN